MAAPLDMRPTNLPPVTASPNHGQQHNTVLPAYQVYSDQLIKLTTITGITMASQIGHKEGHKQRAGMLSDKGTQASLSVGHFIEGPYGLPRPSHRGKLRSPQTDPQACHPGSDGPPRASRGNPA